MKPENNRPAGKLNLVSLNSIPGRSCPDSINFKTFLFRRFFVPSGGMRFFRKDGGGVCN
jgi:hypothetical protein